LIRAASGGRTGSGRGLKVSAGEPTAMQTSAATTRRAVRPSSSGQALSALGCPDPRHELVETRGRPEIGQPGQHVAEIGLRVDAMEIAGLDERSDAGQFSVP